MTTAPLALYGEALMRLIFPAPCGLCKTMLEIDERGVCPNCKSLLWKLRRGHAEGAVQHSLAGLVHAWALFSYEGPFKDLMASIKILKKRWLLALFFEEIRQFSIQQLQKSPYDAIVPIPLDPGRWLEREFNQAEILAAEISRSLKIPVKNLLGKHSLAEKQSRLSKKERLIHLRGAFFLKTKNTVHGLRFLLVDDVMTTGATAQEAAKTLKNAGAKHVDLWALAHTPPAAGNRTGSPS
ncbi:MAG: ComF family protein [Candidatus Omnitrophica bacterium]|nr:ComF family protein [Candidatus Omnitrophota bacterium]